MEHGEGEKTPYIECEQQVRHSGSRRRLSGIQKEQQMTGYRISSAVGGLVRYDVWNRIQVFSVARCQLLANNRTVGRIVLAGRG
jgi:hypothetical protein